MGLLSGLGSLGLDHLEEMDIFAKEEAKTVEKPQAVIHKEKTVDEKDLIYEKNFKCPVCDKVFSAKVMKTARAKVTGSDFDLRPHYENIEAGKYDVLLCPRCGYTALGRYFNELLPAQAKLIKERISPSVKMIVHSGEIYTFDQALERYKLALANAVVKRAKVSEKAFICLKTAWVLRGYGEELAQKEVQDREKIDAIKAQEEEYLKNAYTGFLDARQTENMPICGMDSNTVDYLLAQLSYHFGETDISMRMIQSLLTAPATPERIKNKARLLKEEIAKAKKQ